MSRGLSPEPLTPHLLALWPQEVPGCASAFISRLGDCPPLGLGMVMPSCRVLGALEVRVFNGGGLPSGCSSGAVLVRFSSIGCG